MSILRAKKKVPTYRRRPPKVPNTIGETQEQCELLIDLMTEITHDLMRTASGNKTAAQRVRVDSLKLADEFKKFRKISLREMPRI